MRKLRPGSPLTVKLAASAEALITPSRLHAIQQGMHACPVPRNYSWLAQGMYIIGLHIDYCLEALGAVCKHHMSVCKACEA